VLTYHGTKTTKLAIELPRPLHESTTNNLPTRRPTNQVVQKKTSNAIPIGNNP
jgi:hypothetical protein